MAKVLAAKPLRFRDCNLHVLMSICNFNNFFFHRNVKYSRRQWDGLIKAWKLQIHNWNAKEETDVFQGVDEWKSKEDDPILGPMKDEEEKSVTKKEASSRSFTFNWNEDVSDDEKDMKTRRKVGKKE